MFTPKTSRINLPIQPGLKARAERAAQSQGISLSLLLRQALAVFLMDADSGEVDNFGRVVKAAHWLGEDWRVSGNVLPAEDGEAAL